ncbi:MAG: type II and III secretion system protein family protein [Alphaproteobacteria bacterium]
MRTAKLLLGFCFATALFVAGPALGQQTGGAPPVVDAPDSAPLPDVINLPLNKSRIFRLSTDVRDVLVSNPDIADVVVKTPRIVYVLGQQVGDTNVFLFDETGHEIKRLEIRVDLDLTALRNALDELLPNESVKVSSVNQNVILSGRVRSAQAAEDARLIARRFVTQDTDLLNMIRIDSEQQVLLRVRVAEMQRTVVKELGFNLRLQGGGPTNNTFDFNFGRGPGANAFGSINFDIASTAFQALTAMVDALESQGLIKTLAEPNLTAVSGENANFLVGGEFPIPVPQGNDQVTITFRQFGVLLTFTPVVLSSGVISLKISTEVSQLSTQGQVTLLNFVIPSLTVNRAETTVELPSGGSLIIAGLLQNDIRNSVDGFPGLKDIPILGALFRSVAFRKDETELVVTVTPYLVKPVDNDAISLPTDGFAPASDFDLYLLGRLHDVYAKPNELQPTGKLQGPIGYIME